MTLTVPMSYFVRAYLRASTNEQDAQRARGTLELFAKERGVVICNYYAENESGARLDRPELFRLLADSRPSDVLLVEDVDRLSRLAGIEWEKLKSMIRERQVRVVAVNVPTTWQHLAAKQGEFDARMFSAINDMLMDMLAAIARRDYEQRRERQSQGIIKAKAAGKYQGRKVDHARYEAINRLLGSGSSWSQVQKTIGCSRSTISSAINHAAKRDVISISSSVTAPIVSEQSVTVILSFFVENGSKFTRGKKRSIEEIDNFVEYHYNAIQLTDKLHDGKYRIVISYTDQEKLKEQIDELCREINRKADYRNCVVEISIQDEATDRYWDDYDGVWQEE